MFCRVHDDGLVAQWVATAFKKPANKARLNILERESSIRLTSA